jgi:hypothetical protein
MIRRVIVPPAWSEQILGGIRGAFEPVVLGLLLAWALFVFWRSRREEGDGLDPLLSLAALAFLAATIVLPDSVAETWMFARRWAMWGGACLVLALPAARLRRRAATGAALFLAGGFAAFTAYYWIGFDSLTMNGFEACRAAVPTGSRLLFLDFQRVDSQFYVYPTFQMAAYVALDRPVDLNFSFTEHRSSLVVRRELPRPKPWTPKLEHFPSRVVANDLGYFDAVLLHVPRWAIADVSRKMPNLVPMTLPAEWRLFAVPPEFKHATEVPK